MKKRAPLLLVSVSGKSVRRKWWESFAASQTRRRRFFVCYAIAQFLLLLVDLID